MGLVDATPELNVESAARDVARGTATGYLDEHARFEFDIPWGSSATGAAEVLARVIGAEFPRLSGRGPHRLPPAVYSVA